MCSTLSYVFLVIETDRQVDGGYEKDTQNTPCKECEKTNKSKICRARIDSYPQVMEMRTELGLEKHQQAVVWTNIYIPRYLTWGEIQYKFVGMIIQDSTKKLEHFSSCVEINNKLYVCDGYGKGHLQLLNENLDKDEKFKLSSVIPPESNIVPSRFYYLKDNKGDG